MGKELVLRSYKKYFFGITSTGGNSQTTWHRMKGFTTGTASANTNVGLMGESFKYCAPIAGALKYSVEDTAVAIGLMANAGIKGSRAGKLLQKRRRERSFL